MTDTTAVLAYATPITPAPGERVAFHLSSATLTSADVDIVRIRCADPDPNGPGLQVTRMDCAANGRKAVRHQPVHPGSFAIVEDRLPLSALRGFSIGVFLWPTLPGNGAAQTAIARWDEARGRGWRLGIDGEGHLELVVADANGTHRARAGRALVERQWVFVAARYDAVLGRLHLDQVSLDPQGGRDCTDTVLVEAPPALAWPAGAALTIGGRRTAAGHGTATFNGKIDRPRLHADALDAAALRALAEAVDPVPGDPRLIAAWDFARGIGTQTIHDRSANRLDGTLVHLPTRGVTGANWDGSATSWPLRPQHYGAIHFHDDDMADCGWAPDFTVDIPADWPSGFYALRMSATLPDGEAVESFAGFFVRAPLGQAKAPVAFVASTATFLAYANSALRLDQSHAEVMLEGLIQLSRDDVYLQEHRELGQSTYDTHSDGSGWIHSTALRPILNMRPRGNSFNYVNDTHFIDWMEAKGIAYDVIVDDDIHRHGAALLAQYRCIVTGSHPEYYSTAMWDAFDAYQRGGGRHMYLGGNGFYWRIGFNPGIANAIEVRRDVAGTRTWEGEAGEAHHESTGEFAGIWRQNGRPPQRLVGVGFDAQVFDRSGWYRRLPASFDARAAFVFEGIGKDERIGDFGLRGGGAAGLEIDRADATLGSPPHLLLLATADRIGYGGLPTPEEFRTSHRGMDGEQNSRVRADMILMPTANGGAVFATGSIAWVCSLSPNGYANNVSRITENVLRRFIDPAPIAGFTDEGAR